MYGSGLLHHFEEKRLMAPPITIKKRTVTVKAKSADPVKPAPAEEPTAAVDEDDVDAETADAPVFVSTPRPTRGHGGASHTATTVAAILALVAVLVFLFILLLQWTELRELRPLFPRPMQLGMILASIPW